MLKQWLLKDTLIDETYSVGKAFFLDANHSLEEHRAAIRDRMEVALREFALSFDTKGLQTQHFEGLLKAVSDYLSWLGWSLDDIGYYAIGLDLKPSLMARRIVACHFIYQSGRMFDDLIDEHENYKGLQVTAFGKRLKYWAKTDHSENAGKECLLITITTLLRGIRDYATCFGEQMPVSAVLNLINTMTHACLGAIIELNENVPKDIDNYKNLVELKSTAHNTILLQPFYGIVSPEIFGQLNSFYQQSSFIGQLYNDVFDIEEDLAIDQINYFNFENKTRKNAILTKQEANDFTHHLHELALSIKRYDPKLYIACCAKFSTMIDSSDSISLL